MMTAGYSAETVIQHCYSVLRIYLATDRNIHSEGCINNTTLSGILGDDDAE